MRSVFLVLILWRLETLFDILILGVGGVFKSFLDTYVFMTPPLSL